jgi:hypothetical protein
MASLKHAVSSHEGITSFYASHTRTAIKLVFNGKTMTCLYHHYLMLVYDDDCRYASQEASYDWRLSMVVSQ